MVASGERVGRACPPLVSALEKLSFRIRPFCDVCSHLRALPEADIHSGCCIVHWSRHCRSCRREAGLGDQRRGAELQDPAGSPNQDTAFLVHTNHQLASATRPYSSSVDDVLQHLLVQRQVRDELAKLPVLVLPQPLHPLRQQAVIRFLLVEGSRRDIPARRHISTTGIPFATCFRINAFRPFENVDAFIALRSSRPRNAIGGNSSSERSSCSGAKQHGCARVLRSS